MIEKVKSAAGVCPVCGKTHELITGEVYVESGATERLIRALRTDSRKAFVICDENTEKYACRIAEGAGCDRFALPAGAHATEISVQAVREHADGKGYGLLIACGSGSVHDTVRYFAHESGLSFYSYPTAASVDGFVSGVAAMTWHGQKLTFPAVPPCAVYADDDVYAEAPARLTASGAADILGKFTALFDWRAAHILCGEHLCERIYTLEMDALKETAYAVLHRSEYSAAAYTKLIMNALILSGLAMQLQGNSRPASGSEHHLSHFWEMHLINPEIGSLHGEQVGVGLLCVLDVYKSFAARETLLSDRFLRPDCGRVFDVERLTPVFGALTEGILHENMPNGPASSSLSQIHVPDRKMAEEELRRALAELPSREEAEGMLRAFGAPAAPYELGLSADTDFVRRSCAFAPYVRNRLSLLKVIAAEAL